MATGTVKWFNDDKGFGFIETNDTEDNEDVFVHFTAILGQGYRTLEEDARVEFEIVQDTKGPRAEDVILMD